MRKRKRALLAGLGLLAAAIGIGALVAHPSGPEPKRRVLHGLLTGFASRPRLTVVETHQRRVVVRRVRGDGPAEVLGEHARDPKDWTFVADGVGSSYAVGRWPTPGAWKVTELGVYDAGKLVYGVPPSLLAWKGRIIRPVAVLAGDRLLARYQDPRSPLIVDPTEVPPLAGLIVNDEAGIHRLDLVTTPTFIGPTVCSGDGTVLAICLVMNPKSSQARHKTILYAAADAKMLATIDDLMPSALNHGGSTLVGRTPGGGIAVYRNGSLLAKRTVSGIPSLGLSSNGAYATCRRRVAGHLVGRLEVLDTTSLKTLYERGVAPPYEQRADHTVSSLGQLAVLEMRKRLEKRYDFRLVVYDRDGHLLSTRSFTGLKRTPVRGLTWSADGKILHWFDWQRGRFERLTP